MKQAVHMHVCLDCIRPWEHDDPTCSHMKGFTCDVCAAVKKAEYDQKKVWTEMARNMPIPHSHVCSIIACHEWEHNDKKCALQEIYYLECEVCMTFMHPCPKCGTESEEIEYTAREIRCVCPKCQHYFAPLGQQIYASPAHICPGCGKEANKVVPSRVCTAVETVTDDSVCYACSDCQYFFYAQGQDASAGQEAVQPNSTCSRCEKPFTSVENDLGICPECAYRFRLHNPGHDKEEKPDVCPQCGTHVVSDVCAECGYHILLDRMDDEYDTGVG